jgi:hypothetical protein
MTSEVSTIDGEIFEQRALRLAREASPDVRLARGAHPENSNLLSGAVELWQVVAHLEEMAGAQPRPLPARR